MAMLRQTLALTREHNRELPLLSWYDPLLLQNRDYTLLSTINPVSQPLHVPRAPMAADTSLLVPTSHHLHPHPHHPSSVSSSAL